MIEYWIFAHVSIPILPVKGTATVPSLMTVMYLKTALVEKTKKIVSEYTVYKYFNQDYSHCIQLNVYAT